MAETMDKVAERLARLETTVAEGFHDTSTRLQDVQARFEDLHARIGALDNKFDVVSESLRDDLKAVREVLTAFIDESSRTTAAMRKEHAADRKLTKLVLKEHGGRLRRVERAISSSGR